MRQECFKCLYNQVIKLSQLTNTNIEQLNIIHNQYVSHIDMNKTTPQIMGELYALMLEHIQVEDPYKEIKKQYNELVLSMEDYIDEQMSSLDIALKMAIIGNIIDFAAGHEFSEDNFKEMLLSAEHLQLDQNDSLELFEQLKDAQTLLYLSDNCGEIVLDKCFIKVLKKYYPQLDITFVVRGKPVVNDNTLEDAYFVGIQEYAHVISNGDYSLGTVLDKTSDEFNEIFEKSDVVIAKGQGNYESLVNSSKNNLYFLFMIKCQLVAKMLDSELLSIVCTKNKLENNTEVII